MMATNGAEGKLRGRWLLIMLAILAGALILRLHGITFGLPSLNDPDELIFEIGSVRMLRGPTLNPGWFGHPATTTMYGLALLNVSVFVTGYLAGWFQSIHDFADAIYTDPSWVILPGRVLMVLFAIGTIVLTYRLARDLFDRQTGLAAAALLAVNPVHIAVSQLIRSDIMACFFMLLSMQAALRIAREDRWRDHVFAALWLGLAMATKWPFALAGMAVCGAVVLRIAVDPARRNRSLLRLALFAAMSLGFLLLASPYILLDYPTLVRNLLGEAQLHHLGATGGTPWENAWWYLSGPVFSGFGAVGLVLVAWGAVLLARRREALALLAPVALAFFLLICVQRLVWERWALPLMPLLAIPAGLALVWLYRTARGSLSPRLAAGAIGLVMMATSIPLVIDAQANARERLNDTRQQASQWARAHIPAGSIVLVEHFAFELLPQPWRFQFPVGDSGCVDVRAMLQGKAIYADIEDGRGMRSNVDYGTLTPARRWTCRSDYAILTSYDRYAAERTIFPTEYAAYQALLAQGRIVATFAPRRGEMGGPIVRIVHFPR